MKLSHRFAQGVCFCSVRLFYDAHVEGIENIPERSCILAPNHVSFLDPPLIGGFVINPVYYLARKSLFQSPIMDKIFPALNSIPIDQEKPDMVGLKKIIHLLQTGEKVLLFPEGARSFDGKLQPAQPGIGLVVAKTNVPVVPIRIFGAHEAWPRGKKPRPFKPIRAIVGTPLTFAPIQRPSREDYQKIGEKIMNAIAALE